MQRVYLGSGHERTRPRRGLPAAGAPPAPSEPPCHCPLSTGVCCGTVSPYTCHLLTRGYRHGCPAAGDPAAGQVCLTQLCSSYALCLPGQEMRAGWSTDPQCLAAVLNPGFQVEELRCSLKWVSPSQSLVKLEFPFLVSLLSEMLTALLQASSHETGTRGESGKAWTVMCTTRLPALADSKAQRAFEVCPEKVLSWGETRGKRSCSSLSLVLAAG